MHCPQCQHQNNDTAKFCEECGTRLITVCSQCGHQTSPTAKFCAECGTALTGKSKGKRQKAKGKSFPAKSQILNPNAQSPTPSLQHLAPNTQSPAGERRQLTVLFCDLVGSTALSAQLDPEDYQAVVQAYQRTCTTVIERYDGYIAQYLGDGLLVYFGYPAAHEDEARRAVRAGLEIITALQKQVLSPLAGVPPFSPSPSQGEGSTSSASAGEGSEVAQSQNTPHPNPLPQGAKGLAGTFPIGTRGLPVRIGIHTGLVVIGDIGTGERTEHLALGETPNIAARIQGIAEPNTVALSAATYRLVKDQFDCQDLGTQILKGIPTPMAVYRVLGESATPHRLDATPLTGLTPLVGREEELALLHRRWEQVKDRDGQVALLSGEPGIGKSRLVRELRNRAEQDEALFIEFRCSPYHQNSALQPVIEHLQRVLHWQKDDTPQSKLDKLHTTLARYRFPQADTLVLFSVLLSLPPPADSPPLNLSPQRQKQKTEEALIAWLVEEAEHVPVYCAWEDLHWADPSTLELLGLLIDQTATTRLFVLLASRPEFTPPWGQHAHFSHLTLSRLGRRQVPQMIEKATGNKTLPAEVVQQIVAKTDGVPLFVEELTKMVVESGLLTETNGRYELSGPLPPLAIPSTLQDSLMARLDRLATTKEIAQVGATLGREFSYDVLLAVSPVDESMLQQGLSQLVGAELLYQRGTPPQSTYLFKHALIQDTAYQSLLKSKRQQLHQQIAQVLEEQFPNTKDTQPELLAHHYTEAGLITQAIPYWQQAGERATQRSAYVEAINHFTKGLEVLETLPDTPDHVQQELTFQLALNDALVTVKGYTAPEVEKTVLRARDLCQQVGETPQLFPVLGKLGLFYMNRGELQTTHELAEQMMRLAQSIQDSFHLSTAHEILGCTLYWHGELASARTHLEQAIALHDPQKHPRTTIAAIDLRVNCLSYASWTLWRLGYPDEGMRRSHEALALAEGLAHPFSLAYALGHAAWFHLLRREGQIAQERAEAGIALSTEQGFSSRLVIGTIYRGGALAEQGQAEEGIAQMQQGLATLRVMGAELARTGLLPFLAAAYAKVGQVEEGLAVLAESLAFVDKTGLRFSEAELYRLKGQLVLASGVRRPASENPSPQHPAPSTEAEVEQEAEECFLKAIEIAHKQQAKSLELRAVMSLVRLRQQQAMQGESRNTNHESRIRLDEAHRMLSEIYNWFTEGFDTKDLQEAKALLEELSHRVILIPC